MKGNLLMGIRFLFGVIKNVLELNRRWFLNIVSILKTNELHA